MLILNSHFLLFLTNKIMQIRIPLAYTKAHEQVALRYLREGRTSLSFTEWKLAFVGFDLLHGASITVDKESKLFRTLYQQIIDLLFADQYIEALLQLKNVSQEQDVLRSGYARQILNHIKNVGLYDSSVSGSTLFVSYCLYFWESFATGYAFEVEIFNDLQINGIAYQAHDIRNRQSRLSPYDLEVLGQRGDIKNTLYFLQVGRSQRLSHDFYITRFYEGQKRYTLIVMLQLDVWQKIDGDTIVGLLDEATRQFPHPVQVKLGKGYVVVADYTIWKEKILKQQRG